MRAVHQLTRHQVDCIDRLSHLLQSLSNNGCRDADHRPEMSNQEAEVSQQQRCRRFMEQLLSSYITLQCGKGHFY